MTVAIISNGFADGPAQALRDYLVARDVRVVTIFHPLTPEQGRRHRIVAYADGAPVSDRSVRLPLRPPASFALDPFVPLLPSRVDAWFGSTRLRAHAIRRAPSAPAAGSCLSVDFVPDRFGLGTFTRVYDRLDRMCCRRADARIELRARDARNGGTTFHPSRPTCTSCRWAPDRRVPTTPPTPWAAKRRVPGISSRARASAFARRPLDAGRRHGRGVGSVPFLVPSSSACEARRLHVTFHGYVADHRKVEELLSRSSVGLPQRGRTKRSPAMRIRAS